MSTNTLGALVDLNDKQLSSVLVKRLLPTLRAYQDGQKSILKKGHGTTVQWAKFNSLAENLTATTEGVAPTGEALSPTIIEATALQYARAITLTDVLLQRGRLKCKAEAIKLLKEAGRKMIDSLTINAMTGATKIYYGEGKTSATIAKTNLIKQSDVETALVYLANNDAERFDDGTYHALVSPKMASEIRKFTNFIDKSKYQDPQGRGLIYGEIGRYNGFTFIETTNIPSVTIGENAAAFSCEQLLCYGSNAYGVVDVESQGSNGNPQIIVKGLGSAGTKDPADQEASVGMKFMYVAKILDEKRICKILAPTSVLI